MRSFHAQMFVATLAVARIEHGDQLELLEKVQRPVNCGNIHAAADNVDTLIDSLGSGRRFELMQDRKHQLALRRKPQSVLVEPLH
jgi:hypothetical protein